MIWNKKAPPTIGEYVILLPAFSSPVDPVNDPEPTCTCSVHKAWFDGEKFTFQDVVGLTKTWNSHITAGQCLWTYLPRRVFVNGYTENGFNIEWEESNV